MTYFAGRIYRDDSATATLLVQQFSGYLNAHYSDLGIASNIILSERGETSGHPLLVFPASPATDGKKLAKKIEDLLSKAFYTEYGITPPPISTYFEKNSKTGETLIFVNLAKIVTNPLSFSKTMEKLERRDFIKGSTGALGAEVAAIDLSRRGEKFKDPDAHFYVDGAALFLGVSMAMGSYLKALVQHEDANIINESYPVFKEIIDRYRKHSLGR